MVHNYALKSGPLYRQSYYLHNTEVKIPEERAIRVNFTKKFMLDSNGKVCLNSSTSNTLMHDLNKDVILAVTEVRYEKLYEGKKRTTYGENITVTIDKNSLDQSVEVLTLVKYNGTIVAKTNCTQIQRVMNGTVVDMYATNPDVEDESNFIVLMVLLSIFLILPAFLMICCFFYLWFSN
jgi:hypothetical protein